MSKKLLFAILGIIIGIVGGIMIAKKLASPTIDSSKVLTLKVPIKGITSETDRKKLVKALERIPGVIDCRIDPQRKLLSCDYDTTQISPKQISKKATDLGYSVYLPKKGELKVLDYKINFN